MKITLALAVLLLLNIGNAINAQVYDWQIPKQLPVGLKTDTLHPKTYRMITDYYDYDLKANFLKKSRVAGDVTCFFENDSIVWNNVWIAESNSYDQAFENRIVQSGLENMKYIQSADVLGERFFENFPPVDFRVKNLIWDMFCFYVLAYDFWDELILNVDYSNDMLNSAANLGGDGFFQNKEFTVTWIGVTELDNTLCAIIKYSQMNGKVELDIEDVKMQGRSHYWGEIYVSLSDKQIVFATLKEDVITDVLVKESETNFIGYTVRNITLAKVD